MADEGLWTLSYVSIAARGVGQGDLRHIEAVAQRDNPPLGVTGLLLHCEGTFTQVLEGPRAGVAEIFRRIRASPLHTDIRVLFDEPLAQREFGDWAMLCKEVDAQDMHPIVAAPLGTSRRMLSVYWQAWT